jgi:HEAT repeat protein
VDPALDRMLPANTTAAVIVGDVMAQRDKLAQTAVWRLLSGSTALGPLQSMFDQGWRDLAGQTGMSPSELQDVFGHGAAIACTGVVDGQPGLLAIIASGGSTGTLRDAISQRATGAKTEDWDGVQVRSLPAGGATLYAAFTAAHSLFATDPQALRAALALSQGGGDSLAAAGDYAAAMTGRRNTLCTMFARPAALAANIAALAGDRGSQLAKLASVLELGKVTLACATLGLQNKEFVAETRLDSKAGGLLGALLGQPGIIGSRTSRLVPPDAEAYATYAVNFGKVFDAAIAIAEVFEPAVRNGLDTGIANLKQNVGVDLRADLLANFGDYVVTSQWSRGSAQEFVALVAVQDETRFQQALNTLSKLSPVPLRRTMVQGKETLQVGKELADGVQPAFAVAGGHLVFATNPATLDDILRQVLSPQANADAIAFFGKLPAGTTMASRAPALFALKSQASLLSRGGVTLNTEGLGDLGYAVKTIVRDDQGAKATTTSQLGSTEALTALAIGTAVAMPQLLAARHVATVQRMATAKPVAKPTPKPAQEPAGKPTPDADAATPAPEQNPAPKPMKPQRAEAPLDLLTAIAKAESMYHAAADKDGVAKFGTLDELIASGQLKAETFGKVDSDRLLTADGWRVSVLLPAEAAAAGKTFTAVAWTNGDDARVFVVRQDGNVYRHDALRTGSDSELTPTVVFHSGRPDGDLVAGFVELAIASGPADAAEIAALQAAEAAGKRADVATLTPLLRSRSAAVVARTAWLLGSLNKKDAVQPLLEALSVQERKAVRLQLVAALGHFADLQTMPALIGALDDSDAAVRAQACKALATLHNQRVRDALVSLLERHGKDSGECLDVAAALLALADNGDPTYLMAASTAINKTDGRVPQALAFLFQAQSPKLPANEESTLLLAVLDHPVTLLRRYAIQRLGELRDPSTAKALEGRLASEGPELQPLIKLTLAAARGERDSSSAGNDLIARAKANAEALFDKGMATWKGMDDRQKLTAGGIAAAGIVLIMVAFSLRARSRRRRRIAEMAAMVKPSDPEFDLSSTDDGSEVAAEVETETVGSSR